MRNSGALVFVDATSKSFPAVNGTAPTFGTNQLIAGQYLLQVAPHHKPTKKKSFRPRRLLLSRVQAW